MAGKSSLAEPGSPWTRFVLSQVPKSEAPGATIFRGCSHFSRHPGPPVGICGGDFDISELGFPKPRSVLSQVPKSEAPGATIFSGCFYFSRHPEPPVEEIPHGGTGAASLYAQLMNGLLE